MKSMSLRIGMLNIQSDSKPLRQTLRVDRANNKRGFKANTSAML